MAAMRLFWILAVLIFSNVSWGAQPDSTPELLGWIKKNISIKEASTWSKWNTGEEESKALVPLMMEEEIAYEVQTNLVNRWEETWKTKKLSEFQDLLAKNAKIHSWVDTAKTKNEGLYEKHTWKVGSSSAGTEALEKYFSKLSKIEDVQLNFIAMDPVSAKTFSTDKAKVNSAVLKVRFDIRGLNLAGARRNDRGFFSTEVVNVEGAWKIAKLKLVEGESVIAKTSFFTDTTKEARLDQLPIYTRNEAIRRGGFAISVVDYNNDGQLDLFVGNEGPSEIYNGKSDGTFEKNKSAKISVEKSVKTAIFSDLDNDGFQDLIMAKFNPSKDQAVSIYKNKKGQFSKESYSPENNTPDYAMPAAAGDFNSDGFLDLYVGYPGVKDFTHYNDNQPKARSPHGLYLNDGKGKLAGIKIPAFVTEKGNARQSLTYPHSAVAIDYNQDGHQDIIIMDDRGGISPVFKNLGNGTFQDVSERIGISNAGYGMGTALADFDNDGLMDVVMTNVDFDVSLRMGHAIKSRYSKNHYNQVMKFTRGLELFRNLGNGKFKSVTDTAKLDWIGLGAGGAEFLDYDNDGWQDLYVVNGLWSGSLPKEDLSSYFIRSVVSRLNYSRPTLDFTQSAFWRLLSGLRTGVERSDLKGSVSMAGHQRNRLFRNNQNGTFTEVGYLAGVDSLADGYVVAKADLNKDGKMDLILRNADPGTKEYMFPAVQTFINHTPTNSQSVTVHLEGTQSNRDGIGAKVTAVVGKTKYTHELSANNGSAQSEKAFHIGLGGAEKIDRMTVSWPSGKKTVLENIKPGQILVKEGEMQYSFLAD